MQNNWDFVKFDKVNTCNNLSNFVEGESNTLALALVKSIAIEKQMNFLNLLFLTGDIGTGKTHLVKSIVNESNTNYKIRKSLYLRCETFIYNYIQAVKENCISNFANFYLEYDVIVIDDVHLLFNKDMSQKFLKEILDLFSNENKTIVLTSLVLLNELRGGFEEGLFSRLTKSVVVHINKPSKNTKIEILNVKSIQYDLKIAPDLIEKLMEDDNKSVREVEGELITLLAKSTILGCTPTLKFYREHFEK